MGTFVRVVMESRRLLGLVGVGSMYECNDGGRDRQTTGIGDKGYVYVE